MGPIDKVLDMMGLKAKLPKEMVETSEEKLSKYKYIMDSMTKKEKQDPDQITTSRIERIAKGSGTTEKDARELLKQFKLMKKMLKQFSNIDEKKIEKEGLEGMLKQFAGARKKKKKFRLK
jgi:signal recognition particle subunit SRP54